VLVDDQRWQRQWYIDAARDTGLGVEPLPFFDRRCRPHPIGTLPQRCRLTGAHEVVRCRYYILAAEAQWLERSPFASVAARLRPQPVWTVRDVESGDNLLGSGPDLLTELLLTVAQPGPGQGAAGAGCCSPFSHS
jgi:hypothetical protein